MGMRPPLTKRDFGQLVVHFCDFGQLVVPILKTDSLASWGGPDNSWFRPRPTCSQIDNLCRFTYKLAAVDSVCLQSGVGQLVLPAF